MGKLNGLFSFTGTLAGFTAYERKDMEGTFIRRYSSITRERVYSDPAFENTLKNAAEGGGRSKAAQWLRRVLHPLEPVRVGGWHGALTGALTPVQHLDSMSEYGQRNVLFSRHGHLLDGFCLSRRTPFEGLLRSPLSFTLSKERLQGKVTIPPLGKGVNFFAPLGQFYFRVAAVLGVVPDMVYSPQGYAPAGDYTTLLQDTVYSDWYPVEVGAPATTLPLQLTNLPPNDSFGLLLAVGILFGAVNHWGTLQPVTYQGSGRIVAVV